MTAIRGMAWSLWHRNRVALLIALAHLCAFCLMLTIADVQHIPPFVLAISTLLLVGSYLFLVGIFIFQDADVGSERSAFPPYFFTLPVRTTQLVLVPMALGTVSTFGMIFLATAIARHAGTSLGLWWPATLGATLLALLQAVFWFPFGIPYSKLVLTVLLLPAIGIGTAAAFSEGMSERNVSLALALLSGLSYFMAYAGVVKARRGDSRDGTPRSRPSSRTARTPRRDAPQFRSADQAQGWYEWKQHGKVLPFIAAMLVVVLCMPLAWDKTLSPIDGLNPDSRGLVPTVPTFLTVYYPVLLGMLPWVAWVIGCGARRSDVKRSDRTFQLFYGTRPLSDHRMVGIKFWIAARSALVAWGVVFLMSLPLLLLTGGYQTPPNPMTGGAVFASELHGPVFLVLAKYFTLDVVLRVCGYALLVVAFTWRNYIVGFWTELSGRGWLRHGYPAFWGILIMSFILVGSSAPPHSLPVVTSVGFAIIVWSLVTAKLGMAIGLLVMQVRSGAWSLRMIAGPVATWFVATASAIGIGLFLAEPHVVAAVENHASTRPVAIAILCGLVVLWAPAVRIIAAPLMLTLNRHRAS